MLTVKQAAEHLGVSPAMVYQWCGEGVLAHYRLGGQGRRGKVLIAEPDLAAFLESRKVTPTVSPPAGLRHIRLPS